jgi:hypothetical protein
LVQSHLQAVQGLASGIHGLPDAQVPFAATIGAHRFLNNDRVSLAALAEPLIEAVRQEASSMCDRYLLVVHDWSQLMYPEHTSKKDRAQLSSKHVPEGYELQAALAVSDRAGSPLGPLALSLRAADGVHCSRTDRIRPALSPLDELDPAMRFIESRNLGRPLVHIIDAEADSVGHFRQWSACPGRSYLVRADDRIVERAGQEQKFSQILQGLRKRQMLRQCREVLYHGRAAWQWVAEAPVTLTRAAQRNRPKAGDRRRIPGAPLALRLIISEVRDARGRVLAVWYLLSNLPADVTADTVALWYYWRWQIESYFKLLKSAGLQVESWQQTTAAGIARRLLVASMACVTVWRLSRSTHPQAAAARKFLVRLSGRQMKHKIEFTKPAMLAGMWILLAMLEALQTYTLDELRQFAAICLPQPHPPPHRKRSNLC